MSRFDVLVPEHIRTLASYKPGKPLKQAERECGVVCSKMASNENPLGPSPRAVEAMREAAPFVHLYPDNDATELRNLIAERFDMKPEQVLVTGGSTQFIDIIAHSLLSPGLNAVTSERSFLAYAMATQAAGGTLRQVPMQANTFNLDALLAAIDQNTRVVFIANPNNPTGTMLDSQQVTRFLDRVPSNVLVVLDEAYYEFADYLARQRGVEYSRSLEYVREERNVVVLRTFSKVQGLAGCRVGYGFGPTELIEYFARGRTAFSISVFAEAAAIAALVDEEHTQKTVENNAAGVAWMENQLAEMGLPVTPTWANFVYVDVGEDASVIGQRMQQQGIIVRPLGMWGAPQTIRITIGTPEQNAKCMEALKKALARVVTS